MKKLTALTLALALALPFATNATTFNVEDGDFLMPVVKPIPPEVRDFVVEQIVKATPSRIAALDVNSTGFQRVSDGYTTVSIAIQSIQPYGSGSEIILSVVNWTGVTMTDVKFKVGVGDYNNLSFPTKEESIPKIRPGSEVLMKLRISEKPDQFSGIAITYEGPSGAEYHKAR